MKKVVVFGGGTGLSHLLTTIKTISDTNLIVVVTTADNGGSTGKIREHYGIPAPGDLRRVVIALSEDKKIQELMNYRFDEKLDMHTIGNLILTAFVDVEGNMEKAVKRYCELLEVHQEVYPITNESLELSALMENGDIVTGETEIVKENKKIEKVFYQKKFDVLPIISKRILEADSIIFSFGSLYTSLLPNLIFPEIIEALKKTKAKKIYISNIMTQKGETTSYTLSDHIDAIEKNTYPGIIDYVIANNNYEISEEIQKNYVAENAEIVKIDYENIKCKLIEGNYIIEKKSLCHNMEKIKLEIEKILEE